MNRTIYLTLLLAIGSSLSICAQETEIEKLDTDDGSSFKVSYGSKEVDSTKVQEGTIRFIQDESIGYFNEYLISNPQKHNGYRIQLVFGSKQDVQNAKSKFYGQYDLPAYEGYLAPNFRLRVGDFMTKLLAEKMLMELKKDFPRAYIVKDRIEVPREFR